MKTASYVIMGLWAVLAILAKILLGASWWVATSWIWLPLAIVAVLMFGLNLSVDIGKYLKIRAIKQNPDTCDNCLFGMTAQYDKEGKCLGETLDESIKRPSVCKFHKRQGA
jgi:hypothetical protein